LLGLELVDPGSNSIQIGNTQLVAVW